MGVCCMYVKLLYNTNVNDIGSVVFFSVCVPETPAKKSTMYFCFQTTARSEELQSVMQEERQVCPTTLLKQLNPSRRERKREFLDGDAVSCIYLLFLSFILPLHPLQKIYPATARRVLLQHPTPLSPCLYLFTYLELRQGKTSSYFYIRRVRKAAIVDWKRQNWATVVSLRVIHSSADITGIY